jgi:hypothetical protein
MQSLTQPTENKSFLTVKMGIAIGVLLTASAGIGYLYNQYLNDDEEAEEEAQIKQEQKGKKIPLIFKNWPKSK